MSGEFTLAVASLTCHLVSLATKRRWKALSEFFVLAGFTLLLVVMILVFLGGGLDANV